MAGLDLPFTAISIDADESYPEGTEGGDIPYFISRAKARAYMSQLKDDQLLITAETIVWLDGKMLGKPKSDAEAVDMLRRLSGKTHQVFTGVSFAKIGTTGSRDLEITTIVDRTDVTFKDLTDEEIAYYVQKYRPLDKAGAYGVQEWIGYVACTEMKGSYFNVMGFPVHEVYKVLKQML